MSPRLGFDNCAFAAQRRVLQHIPLQSGHPSRAFGPSFLIMQALFQLHEAGAGLRRQAAIAKCEAMGRSDPYQERAREMAREAGLDSDGRIEGPGQRSMPVWCTFRDAARKEHLAREAADAANTIAAEKPQAPQFQNSPLKVFGEHDHATVAQMRNCMSVGNVVAGVVCADGHLGYAQPVGGVIAYEKQISISGVGFDIGCGNMAIRLDTPV
jgi:hypothetical protein